MKNARSTSARPPRPELLPAPLRGGAAAGQPKRAARGPARAAQPRPAPAGTRPPRPELLPAPLRGGAAAGQPKRAAAAAAAGQPKRAAAAAAAAGQPRRAGTAAAQRKRAGQPAQATDPAAVASTAPSDAAAAPASRPPARAGAARRALALQRRVGTRGPRALQRAAAPREQSDAKVRAPVPELYAAVSDYDGRMAFIAHWIWWEEGVCKVLPIAAEADAAGLESSSAKHPDQTFWKQKLAPRPNKSAAIVTDCKLLPCVKSHYQGCAHALPGIIAAKLGAGIPIACFGHAEGLGQRLVFYTESGASRAEIEEALSHVYTWEWDDEDEYDPSSYQ